MSFKLTQLLSEHSVQQREEMEVVYKDPRELVASEKNFYDTKELKSLKQSISSFGILQPLLIEQDGKGHDVVIAGHRRRLCCIALINEGNENLKKVPCIYKKRTELHQAAGTEEILDQILLIQANNFREKSDWEKMIEAVQMEELIKELRKENPDIRGKTCQISGEVIGVKETQMKRYHAIAVNLRGELMNAFRENRIGISVAYEASGMPDTYQEMASKILKERRELSIDDILRLKAREQQERQADGQLSIGDIDSQIEAFYESLKGSLKDHIKARNKPMVTYLLCSIYNSVRISTNVLNYQGTKEGLIFNPRTDKQLFTWDGLADRLIEMHGKKPKPVKTASVVEEPQDRKTTGVEKRDSVKSTEEPEPRPEPMPEPMPEPERQISESLTEEEKEALKDCIKATEEMLDNMKNYWEKNQPWTLAKHTGQLKAYKQAIAKECPDCQNFREPVKILNQKTGEIREVAFVHCPICGRRIHE